MISGKFSRHGRDELKALIESHGGKNLAAVSAQTDYLVAGEKMGPAKLKKAEKLGVKILSEEEFEQMIAAAETTRTAGEEPEAEAADRSVEPVQGSLF